MRIPLYLGILLMLIPVASRGEFDDAYYKKQFDRARFLQEQSEISVLLPARPVFGNVPPAAAGASPAELARSQLATSRKILDDAIALAKSTDNKRALAFGHYFLGRHLYRRGLFREALQHQREALSLETSEYGLDHPLAAPPTEEIWKSLIQLGEYGNAEPHLIRWIDQVERVSGRNSLTLVRGFSALARIRREQGKIDEARMLAEKAVSLGSRKKDADYMFAVSELAEARISEGRGSEALELLQDATLELRSTTDPRAWVRIAQAQAKLGRVEQANQILKNLQSRNPQGLSPASGLTPRESNQMLYEQSIYSGNFREAVLAAQELQKLASAGDSGEIAAANVRLGLAQFLGGDPKSAATTFDKALEYIRENHMEALLTEWAPFLSPIWAQSGRQPEAERLVTEAMGIARSRYGERSAAYTKQMQALASVRLMQGRANDALDLMRQVTAVHEGGLVNGNRSSLIDEFARSRTSRVVGELHAVAAFSSSTSARSPSERQDLAMEAYQAAQRARATTTNDGLARNLAANSVATDPYWKLVRERERAVENWRQLDWERTQELGRNDGDRLRITRMKTQLDDQESQIRRIETELKRADPYKSSYLSGGPVQVREIQSLLQPDEALISYLVTGAGTMIFVVRRNGFYWIASPQNRAQLNSEVNAVLTSMDLGNGSIPAFNVRAARTLYEAMVRPVASTLEGVRQLIVIPDGPLQRIPFSVFVSGNRPGTAGDDLRDLEWLGFQIPITYVPSEASLAAVRPRSTKSRSTDVLGIGDPKLGSKGTLRGRQLLAAALRGARFADVATIRQLPSLPETSQELKRMAEALRPAKSVLLTGEQATETRVKSLDLTRYKVISFATHGIVGGEIEGTSEPALILTPPSVPTEQDDGALTASEVVRLNLDAELVLLSACNTAAPDPLGGAEGFSGLTKAFIYAGARSVMVSHWSVPSETTVELTSGVFELMAREPALRKSEALSRSMQRLFLRKDLPVAAHPAFWAPFVLVGAAN